MSDDKRRKNRSKRNSDFSRHNETCRRLRLVTQKFSVWDKFVQLRLSIFTWDK